ncbi:hypothetical protein ACFU5O_29700 [Streptomyces sp. NPDC057445]|uniref:hypothetical protein n=1 Tax=Streptomyces sp. NPDC057445 TaxID=3346136 RepID=UPI0036A249C3
MHGHGYAPPPPTRRANGGQVVLRVVLVALTMLSCGFLGWAPMLRLGLLTRRRLHWGLFGAVIASTVGILVFAGTMVPDDQTQEMSDPVGFTLVIWLLLATVGVTTYYLVAEIRHFEQSVPLSPGYIPPQTQTQMTGYGYPQVAQAPVQTPPAPSTPVPGPPVQNPYAQPVQQQYTPPAPQPAADRQPNPARIDQVRAELDELSDILRRDKDQREGGR